MQPDTHGMNGLRRLARADECSVVAGRAARPMALCPIYPGGSTDRKNKLADRKF